MSAIMSQNQDLNFNSTKNYYEEARKEADSSYFVSHTWPVVLVLLSYSSFIYIDIKFNKQRKPMKNLKFIMFLFNIYQVVTNAQIVYLGILPDSVDYLTNYACHPADPAKNHLWSRGITAGRMFLVSKVADLLDTVFIVLRKKESQLSFLHLYHHFSMVAFAWYCIKYVAGEQLVIILIVNPFVHVIMYSYYALSLLGAPIQKYLWWKKYITLLQLSQFVIYMGYMAVMVLLGCDHSVPLTIFVFIQGYIFFALFKDFYTKSYGKNKVPAEVAESKKTKVT